VGAFYTSRHDILTSSYFHYSGTNNGKELRWTYDSSSSATVYPYWNDIYDNRRQCWGKRTYGAATSSTTWGSATECKSPYTKYKDSNMFCDQRTSVYEDLIEGLYMEDHRV
jgi:hypothetical protein